MVRGGWGLGRVGGERLTGDVLGEELSADGKCDFVLWRPYGVDEDILVGPRNNLDVFRCGVSEDGAVVEHLNVHIRHGGGIVRGIGDVDLGFEEDGGRSGLKNTESSYLWGEPGHVAF